MKDPEDGVTVDLYEYYPNLEPNHGVTVTDDGFQVVVCPFTDEAGLPFLSSWSPNANPEEVNCLFCEYLNGALQLAGPPEHAGETDGSPGIAGGAHGGRHHVSEYQPCKVPNRRWTWCRISIVAHEGLMSKIEPVSVEYERRIAAGETWRITQEDTAFYVCRRIAGSSSWSKHSWGCAGDIKWKLAPYGTRKRDHPPWFVAAMKRCGMGDGIEWSTPDPMHYSAFPNEGGDGWLYVGHTLPTPTPGTDEEDDMLCLFLMKDEQTGRIYAMPDLEDAIYIAHPTDLNDLVTKTRAAGIKCTDVIEVHGDTIRAFAKRDGEDS